jgi:hypothetical protein
MVRYASVLVGLSLACSSKPERPFDATGYYFPSEPSGGDGYYLKWVALSGPTSSVRTGQNGNEDTFTDTPCPNPLIARDTLEIHCAGTPMGDVTVAGAFLHERSESSDPRQQPALRALAIITSNGVRSSHQLTFTRWAGD